LVCFSDRVLHCASTGFKPRSSYLHLANSWDYRYETPCLDCD
jgi:hypothetical protein